MRAQAMDALGDAHTLRRACRAYTPVVLAALQELGAVDLPDAVNTRKLSLAPADGAASAGLPRGADAGGGSTAFSGIDLVEVSNS